MCIYIYIYIYIHIQLYIYIYTHIMYMLYYGGFFLQPGELAPLRTSRAAYPGLELGGTTCLTVLV